MLFREVGSFEAAPLRVAAPQPASIDPHALVLVGAACLAAFRFEFGAVRPLLAAVLAGLMLSSLGLVSP